MKSFLQFVIPLVLIILVGAYISKPNKHESYDLRLYVKCGSYSKRHSINVGDTINVKNCNLDLNVIDISEYYVKLNSPYVWKTDHNEQKVELTNTLVIEKEKDNIYYLKDEDTKISFELK